MKNIVYAVITKTDVEPDGNLADDLIYYDRHLKAWRQVPLEPGWSGKDPKHWKQLKFEVFELGEIVVLEGGKYGREVCGHRRKPCKWYVEYECFTSIEKAVKRAKEITHAT